MHDYLEISTCDPLKYKLRYCADVTLKIRSSSTKSKKIPFHPLPTPTPYFPTVPMQVHFWQKIKPLVQKIENEDADRISTKSNTSPTPFGFWDIILNFG